MFMIIVSQLLVEADERVVVSRLLFYARDNRIHAHVDAVLDTERAIANVVVLVVDTSAVVSAAHTLALAILVNTPEVIDTIVDRLLVAPLAEECWRNGPESHVLRLQFEQS